MYAADGISGSASVRLLRLARQTCAMQSEPHCGTEAAASVVITVNHIHTLTRALCASLQSAAVQAHYTRVVS